MKFDHMWPAILEQIAHGSSLSAVSRQQGAPSYSWLKAQIRANAELSLAYVAACEDRGDFLAERIEQLAGLPIPQDLDGPGKHAWVARLRVEIDALRWCASKLRPARYGDRMELSVPDTQKINVLTVLERARARVAGCLAEQEKAAG